MIGPGCVRYPVTPDVERFLRSVFAERLRPLHPPLRVDDKAGACRCAQRVDDVSAPVTAAA